jgi:hypothetical protein
MHHNTPAVHLTTTQYEIAAAAADAADDMYAGCDGAAIIQPLVQQTLHNISNNQHFRFDR